MTRTYWTFRRVFAGLSAFVALGLLTACSEEASGLPPNSAPVIVPGEPGADASTIPPGQAEPLPEERPTDADIRYVRNMIVHHQQAVEMAELAPRRAASSDVKGLASRIADVQGPEIAMMNRWLSDHAQPTVNPTAPGGHGGHGTDDHATMPGMASPEQLATLKDAKGEVFDTLFLQMMIRHHQGALTMADEVRSVAMDVRVQQMLDDIVAEQSDEIRRMQEWLAG